MSLNCNTLFPLVSSLCFSVNGLAANTINSTGTDKNSECVYIAPQRSNATNVFDEVKTKSDQNTETFSTMATFFHEIKESCHQFYFKYPLQSAEQAKIFAKILQIKAQEAHRFVPVIASCQFLEPRNLGFSRQIEIVNGPIVQEHLLVDTASDSVIFVEEFAVMPNGEVFPGTFTALNSIIEENGSWYFSGIYLYPDQPNEKQVQERQAMCKKTFENMIDFMNKDNVDFIFNKLKKY